MEVLTRVTVESHLRKRTFELKLKEVNETSYELFLA